jgi:hypothetical protein
MGPVDEPRTGIDGKTRRMPQRPAKEPAPFEADPAEEPAPSAPFDADREALELAIDMDDRGLGEDELLALITSLVVNEIESRTLRRSSASFVAVHVTKSEYEDLGDFAHIVTVNVTPVPDDIDIASITGKSDDELKDIVASIAQRVRSQNRWGDPT